MNPRQACSQGVSMNLSRACSVGVATNPVREFIHWQYLYRVGVYVPFAVPIWKGDIADYTKTLYTSLLSVSEWAEKKQRYATICRPSGEQVGGHL